jgi:peptidoglycan/LPS O-acetylase OafA/YrhL
MGAAPTAVEAVADEVAAVRRNRFNELEAVRGVAAALIVVFHAYQFSRDGDGFVWEGRVAGQVVRQFESGVAWFFVLSAFLLYLPIARSALEHRPPGATRSFLVRRSVRILPLYVVAVLIVWALRNPSFPGEWRDLVEHLTFTQIYDSKRIFFTIGPAWSLAVEVHFYLLLAVLAPLLTRVTRGRAAGATRAMVFGVPVLLAALSVAFRLVAQFAFDVPGDRWAVWFSFPAKLDNFALGMLVAATFASASGRASPHLGTATRVALRVAGLGLVAAAFALPVDTATHRVWFHTLSAVAAALIIASSVFAPPGTRWERVLAVRPLATLGLLSYSLYLWHEPVLLEASKRGWLFTDTSSVVVNALVLLAVSLAVAFASYWVLEYPTGYLRHLFDDDGRLVEHGRIALTRLDPPPPG